MFDAEFHGLRSVRLSADIAPPVATVRRPVGAILAPKGCLRDASAVKNEISRGGFPGRWVSWAKMGVHG